MATTSENKSFAEEMIGISPLDTAIEWIKDHMTVDEVFDDDDIKDYVASNFDPEDVFDASNLERWAEENGYTEEE